MADASNPFSGLLGSGFSLSPLTQFGLGLLAQSGPSTTPQSPWAAIGRAGLGVSEAQQNALQNELLRQKVTEGAKEQQALTNFQDWAKQNPGASDQQVEAAATQFFPELAIKARLGNMLSAKDQIQMLQIQAMIQGTQANLAKTLQETRGLQSEALTPATGVMQAVEHLDTAFDTVQKEGNPFGPSGMFNKEAPLGRLGINAETALGLPNVVLKQFGDPEVIKKQAQVAQLIDKETATISQNLTQLATRGTGRSATAINNLNTALGEGNISVPVRRLVISQALDQVLTDLRTNGIEYDPSYDKLSTKLHEQTKDVAAPTGATIAPALTTQTAPAPQGTTVPQAIGGMLDSTGEVVSRAFGLPQPAPAQPAPGNVPGFSMVPGSVPAATAAPGPPARSVKTTPMRAVPAIPAGNGNPGFPGGSMPVYPRQADGARAVGHGAWFMTPDGGVWYNP